MRILIVICICVFAISCKTKSKLITPAKATRPASAKTKPIVTLPSSAGGKITSVNRSARFVVITFTDGESPAVGQRLNVYRNGLKVGELKVTGPKRDENTVADIIAGEAQLNDEARED